MVESDTSKNSSKSNGAEKSVKKKKFQEYEKGMPVQLTFFHLLDKSLDSYSQTIELYDFMPKYVIKNVERFRVEGRFLDPIVRRFRCRDKDYEVTLIPAKVQAKDGSYKDHFLGVREEVVEEALRKLVVEGKGIMLDNELGLCFTLYQLEMELKQNNHTYSLTQIKDALYILATSSIKLTGFDENPVFDEPGSTKKSKPQKELIFHPLETLAIDGVDGETNTFIRFSPLVTKSINSQKFRLYNYGKSMQLKSFIARQLFKRVSHHFTQADITQTYTISLLTLIRDFGLTRQKRLRNNITNIEEALQEMYDKNHIIKFNVDPVYDSKRSNKVVDAIITLVPSVQFSNDSRKANALTRNNEIEVRKNNNL